MLTETIPQFAPGFDIGLERERRKQAVIEADTNLSAAIERLKGFQGARYAVDASGRLVPRVARTGEVVSNELVDLEHQRLVRTVSERHDEFQKALRCYSEVTA
jgi:hypothetical protein